MNTNYDEEATQYQGANSEETQFENSSASEQGTNKTSRVDEVQVKAVHGTWKRTAMGAGSGLLIGGVASVLMGMKQPGPDPVGQTESDNHIEEVSNPDWVDNQIQVASTVNDDMSFGEAFAAARAEVGPGGCFEWHGNIYSTYLAEEWNSMTDEQRAEYSDHFSWNHIDHSSSDVAQHSVNQDNGTSHAATTEGPVVETNDDDIEIVSVNHEDNPNGLAQTDINPQTTNQAEAAVVSQTEPEIEILGVVHDNETGANIGGMIVDGQEVILIDVDDNMEFDYMAADLNGNGQVDPEELVDIQGQGLTVNDLGGLSNPTGEMLASNEGPDYSTESVYES